MFQNLKDKIRILFLPKNQETDNVWLSGKVMRGRGLAKKIKSPTLNFNNPKILLGQKEGVYACFLKINKKTYQGVLYYGPRLILKEKENILEIFVFDFNKEVYGETVFFKLAGFIREPRNFPDFNSLKRQLKQDYYKAIKILESTAKW